MTTMSAVVATAAWAMFPAYLANTVAAVVGGGRPIDGGRTLGDNRLLGDGKTWRGLVGGTAAGVVGAAVLSVLAAGLSLPAFGLRSALGLSAGALVGDAAASFLKRRAGRPRGSEVPGLDQLDLVAGALALSYALDPGWFLATFSPLAVGAVVVLTPPIHLLTNVAGYVLGLKREPW